LIQDVCVVIRLGWQTVQAKIIL